MMPSEDVQDRPRKRCPALDRQCEVQVGTEDGTFLVVIAESGRTVLVCRDRTSADRYAVMLNEAFDRGHRAGRRDARRAMGK